VKILFIIFIIGLVGFILLIGITIHNRNVVNKKFDKLEATWDRLNKAITKLNEEISTKLNEKK